MSAAKFSYDAFISFQGDDDAGSNFSDYLVGSLEKVGLCPFKSGSSNTSPPETTVKKDSRVSIIVFSKKYAASARCLDEMQEILQKKKNTGHQIVPVFYKVDPSHVRKQKDHVEKELAQHKDQLKVEGWKGALLEFGSLVGKVFPNPGYRTEIDFIDDILEETTEKVLAHKREEAKTKPQITYDVFFHYEAEDRKKALAECLGQALVSAGFRTFKAEHEKGDQVMTSKLKEALRMSRCSIVLLSEGYAYSSSCLDLLLEMVNCKKTVGHIIMPVFFRVTPSEVRTQTGRFAYAFDRHESEFGDKVEEWKEALGQIAFFAGMGISRAADYRKQEKIIAEFVKEVASKLTYTSSYIKNSLDAIDAGTIIHGKVSVFPKKCPPGGADKVVLYTTGDEDDLLLMDDEEQVEKIMNGYSHVVYEKRNVSLERKYMSELEALVGKRARLPALFLKGRQLWGVKKFVHLEEMNVLGYTLK